MSKDKVISLCGGVRKCCPEATIQGNRIILYDAGDKRIILTKVQLKKLYREVFEK